MWRRSDVVGQDGLERSVVGSMFDASRARVRVDEYMVTNERLNQNNPQIKLAYLIIAKHQSPFPVLTRDLWYKLDQSAHLVLYQRKQSFTITFSQAE